MLPIPFISDEGFQNKTFHGKQGFTLKVRLTSYRSLPLSCIEGILLKVDGEEIPAENILFTLNNYTHKLSDLAVLSHVWWFILDYAELFVAKEGGLSAGEHRIEGTLITVEPYMTAGRFSFYSKSQRLLKLDTPPQEVTA